MKDADRANILIHSLLVGLNYTPRQSDINLALRAFAEVRQEEREACDKLIKQAVDLAESNAFEASRYDH